MDHASIARLRPRRSKLQIISYQLAV